MARHRALAEEQRRGHLAVRPTRRDEHGDALLGRRQTVDPRPAADPPELGAGFLRPTGRPERLEPYERRLDRLPGRALPPGAPPDHAEREQSTSPAEWIADLFVLADRLLQCREAPSMSPRAAARRP